MAERTTHIANQETVKTQEIPQAPTPKDQDLIDFLNYDENLLNKLKIAVQQTLKTIETLKMWGYSKRGEAQIHYDGWCYLARRFGFVPSIEWTKPLVLNNKIIGWEARAILKNRKGITVTAAEAVCSKDEKGRENMPISQLKSLAQTRAVAKAIRAHLSWLITLAGGFSPEKKIYPKR